MYGLGKELQQLQVTHSSLRQPSWYKLTFKYFFLAIALQSAAPSRPRQVLRIICKFYLTALSRIDEHIAAVDDNEEFDENTRKENNSYHLSICACRGSILTCGVCYRIWWFRRCGSSVLAGRPLWCFDSRIQSSLPSGSYWSSKTRLLTLSSLLFYLSWRCKYWGVG